MTRSVGILMSRYNLDNESRNIFNPTFTVVGCVAIWALALWCPYYFNDEVRYEVLNGKCKQILSDPPEGFFSGLYLYNVAIYVPLFFILVSYIFISTVLEVEKRRKQRILDSQTQIPVRQIQVTLVALSAIVLIFGLPISIISNITFEDKDTERTAFAAAWGWCYWMYAANFVLYVTTLEDFRMMFKQVLKELICCLPVAASRKANVDEMSSTKKSSTISIL